MMRGRVSVRAACCKNIDAVSVSAVVVSMCAEKDEGKTRGERESEVISFTGVRSRKMASVTGRGYGGA